MSRIQKEQRMVEQMILIYCKGKHGKQNAPCDSCKELIDYAHVRLNRCRYGEEKTFCSHCSTHCYQPEMRKRIKEIMRYAGPRMLFYSPWTVIRHILGR